MRMNAQELTKKYHEQEDRIIRLERSVNALAEECGKLRLLLSRTGSGCICVLDHHNIPPDGVHFNPQNAANFTA